MPPLASSILPTRSLHRPGEGAALVAEQLALHQVLGHRGAVDGDEAAGAPLALEVDGARRQLLAGARLAGDQHRHVVARQHLEGGEDLQHDRVAAHHVGEGVAVRQLAAQVLDLVDQPPALERLLRREQQLLGLERLGDVVDGALAHRLDGVLDAAVAGDHDHVDVAASARGCPWSARCRRRRRCARRPAPARTRARPAAASHRRRWRRTPPDTGWAANSDSSSSRISGSSSTTSRRGSYRRHALIPPSAARPRRHSRRRPLRAARLPAARSAGPPPPPPARPARWPPAAARRRVRTTSSTRARRCRARRR